MRGTVRRRGAHGLMPQVAVDPVVLAAMIVVRLQTVVSREVRPGDSAVLTVGSIQAGTKSNVIPDTATILLTVRTYREDTQAAIMQAIERIVTAECAACRSPWPPEFEVFDRFPLTDNDEDATLRAAFAGHVRDDTIDLHMQSASEDFSDIPRELGVPHTYWGVGGVDAALYQRARATGRVADDIPVNDSARFAPVIDPTLGADAPVGQVDT
jgi:hippurate hydrolase